MPSAPDIGLINAAYVLIGAEPIQSIDQELPGAQSAALVYSLVIDDLLGFYPWSFAKETRKLQKIDGTPNDGWANAFVIPPDSNGLPVACSNKNDFSYDFTKFSYAGMEVHSDADEIWAILKVFPRPEIWSSTFRYAATLALAGSFALSVTSDKDLCDRLMMKAFGPPELYRRGGAMGVAIQTDAINQPSQILASDGGPLIAARHSGLYDW